MPDALSSSQSYVDSLERAMICAWCREPVRPVDAVLLERGARLSHGICEECRDEYFGEADNAQR